MYDLTSWLWCLERLLSYLPLPLLNIWWKKKKLFLHCQLIFYRWYTLYSVVLYGWKFFLWIIDVVIVTGVLNMLNSVRLEHADVMSYAVKCLAEVWNIASVTSSVQEFNPLFHRILCFVNRNLIKLEGSVEVEVEPWPLSEMDGFGLRLTDCLVHMLRVGPTNEGQHRPQVSGRSFSI